MPCLHTSLKKIYIHTLSDIEKKNHIFYQSPWSSKFLVSTLPQIVADSIFWAHKEVRSVAI